MEGEREEEKRRGEERREENAGHCLIQNEDHNTGWLGKIILTKGPTIRSCEYLEAGEMMEGGQQKNRGGDPGV